MDFLESIPPVILAHFPTIQAVYLFGSCAAGDEWPDSDVDIALLLPPVEAKRAGFRDFNPARLALERVLTRDVDLINLRRVSTIFQKEIIMAERRIYCPEVNAADEFEMLVISLYQKLNQERAEILAEGLCSGRFYSV